jgi:hypothetical protein
VQHVDYVRKRGRAGPPPAFPQSGIKLRLLTTQRLVFAISTAISWHSTAAVQASGAKFFLADIPPNYHELRGKNLEILGVAIRNEILKFGFVI